MRGHTSQGEIQHLSPDALGTLLVGRLRLGLALLLCRLLRLRTLLHLTERRLTRSRAHLRLLVALLLDELKRRTHNRLGGRLGDLASALLVGVLKGALLVHATVHHRPRQLAGIQALREERPHLLVDELEALGIATDEKKSHGQGRSAAPKRSRFRSSRPLPF